MKRLVSVRVNTIRIVLACVAGGISRASAFVLVSEAVNTSGEAVRGLVKSRVEFANK